MCQWDPVDEEDFKFTSASATDYKADSGLQPLDQVNLKSVRLEGSASGGEAAGVDAYASAVPQVPRRSSRKRPRALEAEFNRHWQPEITRPATAASVGFDAATEPAQALATTKSAY